jgi:hypothetical protein
MGYAPPEHRRFRCVVSYFYYCILLKKHGFKSKPHISVRMRPLVLDAARPARLQRTDRRGEGAQEPRPRRHRRAERRLRRDPSGARHGWPPQHRVPLGRGLCQSECHRRAGQLAIRRRDHPATTRGRHNSPGRVCRPRHVLPAPGFLLLSLPVPRTPQVPAAVTGSGQTTSKHCLPLWGMKLTVLDQCNLSDLHIVALLP